MIHNTRGMESRFFFLPFSVVIPVVNSMILLVEVQFQLWIASRFHSSQQPATSEVLAPKIPCTFAGNNGAARFPGNTLRTSALYQRKLTAWRRNAAANPPISWRPRLTPHWVLWLTQGRSSSHPFVVPKPFSKSSGRSGAGGPSRRGSKTFLGHWLGGKVKWGQWTPIFRLTFSEVQVTIHWGRIFTLKDSKLLETTRGSGWSKDNSDEVECLHGWDELLVPFRSWLYRVHPQQPQRCRAMKSFCYEV